MKKLTKKDLAAPKVAAALEAGKKETRDMSFVIMLAEALSREMTAAENVASRVKNTYGVTAKDVLDAKQLATLEKLGAMQDELREIMNTCVAYVDGSFEARSARK